MTTRNAAQYIRMSTEKQDLSPSVQREAIAAYAAAREMQIVATYEDDGRSGVRLKNRPALLKLLHDVTEPTSFNVVLVYDVSRWGRFQDTDAAAYYEYHCRLHDVDVVYVAELFGAELNPIAAMLKSIKRAMAAEYSRDLSIKARAGHSQVIARGFQVGPLPPLGYRRSSVSADGQRRVVLDSGQRKLAATDRIEWVLASQAEQDLVKRICHMYAHMSLSFNDIARIGGMEGWRDHRGRGMSGRSVATLLRNEALIGNFVWGRGKLAKSIVRCEPSRNDGCIARLIDDDTWARIQRRTALEVSRKQTDEQIVANLNKALDRNPLLSSRDLGAQGLPSKRTIRARLGSWTHCMAQVGRDSNELSAALFERTQCRKANSRAFGVAIAARLREDGQVATFDGRLSVLDLPGLRMRLRLLWPVVGELGQAWRIRVERISRDVDFDLLVRMEDLSRAKDYFVVPPADVVARFPQWLIDPLPTELARYGCQSPPQLLERIRALNDRSGVVLADTAGTAPDNLRGMSTASIAA